MSDHDYAPSSPGKLISKRTREHKKSRQANRENRKSAPYNLSPPSPKKIKSESPSPSRVLRPSALRANEHFGADDQFGFFLNSQVGENTYVDSLYHSNGIPSSPASDFEPKPAVDIDIVDQEIKSEPCTNFECSRLTRDLEYSYHEREYVYSEWRIVVEERDEARKERDEARSERAAVEAERDAAVLERDQWRRATKQFVDTAGSYLVFN
ncbi:hypothetical protein K438DRAFT_1976135 [Mycena galopus ATCC 62051]|nr:hypothetical protein K438DRAFT_1976135 [Mycena galopus ATCC 62051]